MNRLVLIDGSAILHRAYHALPPLTAPDGKLVNAVYGVVSILLKLYHDFSPTHMAVAFDRPKPTFRKKLFKEYQAQRPKLDGDLVSQITPVHETIESLGVPIYEVDGFEADDIIGTIAEKATSDKRQVTSKRKKISDVSRVTSHVSLTMDEVIIVTGDRDLLQLVDDKKGIKVFMPVKGLAEGKVFGEIEAKEKFGVVPTLIPDYKGLAGDQSDNYPGVAGIGPKTAAGLVEKFGSIEGVYRELEEKGKRKKEKGNEHLTDRVIEKLKKGKESALLSKNLATIRTDAPIDVSFDKMKVATLITPQARMKLAEFGFKSLLKRLSGESDMKKSEKPKKVSAEKPKKHDEEQLTLV